MPAASRWSSSSTRLNSANTAADSPDTPERQIVGGKRRSMNRSDIRMREYLCRRLSAARRRQKYELCPAMLTCMYRQVHADFASQCRR